MSTRRSVYEWAAIAFLLTFPLVGISLLGAVRLWISGPLLMLCFTGVSLTFLRPLFTGDLQTVRIPPAALIWTAFLLYGVLVSSVAMVPHDAWIEMLYLASYVGAYWAWTELTSCYRRWRIILGGLIAVVTILAWYAIIQHANESRMVLIWERPEAYEMRASATFFCPNHFAHLLAITLCICAALGGMAAAGAPLRLLALYGMGLCLPALFLTQSRSGWIGAALGLATTVLMAMWRKSRQWFLATLLAGPIVALLFGALLWMSSEVFRERVLTAMPGAQGSTADIRLNIWQDTVPMIEDAPVIGHGPGSYRWLYPAYRSFRDKLWARYAHNEYLHTIAEYGIAGFLLIALAIGVLVIRMLLLFRRVSRDRDALMIAGLMGVVVASLAHAFFDYNLHIPASVHVIVMFAGLTAGGIFSSEDLPPTRMNSTAARVFWIAGAFIAFVFAVMSVHAYAVDNLLQRGEKKKEKLELRAAQDLFASARALDPQGWEPRLKLANVLRTRAFWELDPEHKKGLAERARVEFEAAARRNPGQVEALFGLSQIYELLGDPEQAEAYIVRAAEYDRKNSYYANQLGLFYRRRGMLEESLEAFRKTLSLDGANETARLNIGSLEQKLKK